MFGVQSREQCNFHNHIPRLASGWIFVTSWLQCNQETVRTVGLACAFNLKRRLVTKWSKIQNFEAAVACQKDGNEALGTVETVGVRVSRLLEHWIIPQAMPMDITDTALSLRRYITLLIQFQCIQGAEAGRCAHLRKLQCATSQQSLKIHSNVSFRKGFQRIYILWALGTGEMQGGWFAAFWAECK